MENNLLPQLHALITFSLWRILVITSEVEDPGEQSSGFSNRLSIWQYSAKRAQPSYTRDSLKIENERATMPGTVNRYVIIKIGVRLS